MFRIKSLLALAGACLLAGCAAHGSEFTDAPPPGDKALVYIYRSPTFALGGAAAGFDVDEKRVGTLDPGGYTYFHVATGHYEIKQFWAPSLVSLTTPGLWKSIKQPLDVNAGETRYFRFGTDWGGSAKYAGGITLQWNFIEVRAETARQEIAQEKFQPQDKNMPVEFKP